ncbi:hypothetical protein [Bordetella genomosp. 10]|uniref:hypothetical protein n=1 Tax=Bordetella genomosp. 10 TaxID=1416804 RepID=UPI0015C58D5F|nr:hypothetical protein [Bordetella genomosp. 10]
MKDFDLPQAEGGALRMQAGHDSSNRGNESGIVGGGSARVAGRRDWGDSFRQMGGEWTTNGHAELLSIHNKKRTPVSLPPAGKQKIPIFINYLNNKRGGDAAPHQGLP